MDWLLGGQPLLHTLESMPPTHLMRRAVDWALSNDIPGLGGGDLQVTRIIAGANELAATRCVLLLLLGNDRSCSSARMAREGGGRKDWLT